MVKTPHFRVVLQARTNSSRLPAKVLLPIGNMPMAVLAAKRVAHAGGDVVVAVPDTEIDNALAEVISGAGLKMIRGPLDDVLARFILATDDLQNDAICVRLTCDNPIPDTDFVSHIVDKFSASGARYLAYGNDGLWLPYGLSAEVFCVGDLRTENTLHPDDPYIREHVTPSLRESFAPKMREAWPNWPQDLGHLRCSVDTLDDYLAVERIFADIPDPVSEPWRDIVDRLRSKHSNPCPGLVLGTVQLGLAYGLAEGDGVMPEATANAILKLAPQCGCIALDTARAYGVSEQRIGSALRPASKPLHVITKLAPFDEGTARGDDVEDSIRASMTALDQSQLDTVLLHRADQLTANDGHIWNKLLALQSAGTIGSLGVSIQSPKELVQALAIPSVTHIQMPFNILETRWWPYVSMLRQRSDVTLHIRSVFLQGLLLQNSTDSWPAIAGVFPPAILNILEELRQRTQRTSLVDLCLAYVRAFSFVDGVVVGVDSEEQLRDISALFEKPSLTWEEVNLCQRMLPKVSENLLDPAQWPRSKSEPPPSKPPVSGRIETVSRPFTIFCDQTVIASFPTLLQTSEGVVLSFRIAPREPYDFDTQPGHQQHLHPRSALAIAHLDDYFTAQNYRLFPVDLFAADQDPNLSRLPDGKIIMSSFSWRPQAFGEAPIVNRGFFTEKSSNVTAQFWGSFTAISDDEGRTWGPRSYLPRLPGHGDLIDGRRVWHGGRHRGQLVICKDSRLLIGTYERIHNKAPFRCFLYESLDNGVKWQFAGCLTETEDASVGFAEPTLYHLANGDIMALHRTFGAGDVLAVTRSQTEGRTWSAPEFHTNIVGHPYHVVDFSEDWAIMLYAQRSAVSSIKARLICRRTGKFAGSETIIQIGATSRDIGYPTGLQLQDGRILVAYYWIDDEGTRVIEGALITCTEH